MAALLLDRNRHRKLHTLSTTTMPLEQPRGRPKNRQAMPESASQGTQGRFEIPRAASYTYIGNAAKNLVCTLFPRRWLLLSNWGNHKELVWRKEGRDTRPHNERLDQNTRVVGGRPTVLTSIGSENADSTSSLRQRVLEIGKLATYICVFSP